MKSRSKTYKRPYAPPRKLERDLAGALAFWDRLKRRNAKMPFWDDVHLSTVPELVDKLIMIEATDMPVRFRFAFRLIGKDVERGYAGNLDAKFLDEIDVRYPLQFLISQCSATVESGEPTYYRHGTASGVSAGGRREYARLLLPLWGEGRIGMLLGGFVWK